MDEEKKRLNDLGPGIEVLESGIKTTGKILGGGCICSPGGKWVGSEMPTGCHCGCWSVSPADLNGDANDKLS